MRAVTVLFTAVTLAACSTGYDTERVERELASAKVAYTSNRATIAELAALKPKRELPVRIAIAPPARGQWSRADLEVLESWKKPLEKAGIASDLLILPEGLVTPCADWRDECRLEQARAAALRAHADAVLILHFASATDSYPGPRSLLYLSVVGMWLVKATRRDALTVVEGLLLDAQTEYLYAFARSEGERNSITTLVEADRATVLAESRTKALRKLGRRLAKNAGERRVSLQ